LSWRQRNVSHSSEGQREVKPERNEEWVVKGNEGKERKRKKIGRKKSKDRKKAHMNLRVAFFKIGDRILENFRTFRKRIKQETR
jgi:hypothetical protein